MSATLYKLKSDLSIVGAELKNVEEEIRNKVADPTVPIEEIHNLKTKAKELQERFDSFQPTYEELKLNIEEEKWKKVYTVFSLPMRN